jgi:hypothetical protein
MPRRPDARTLLFEKIRTSAPKFVHVTGVPYSVEQRPVEDPATADVIWLTIEAPPFGRLRVSINTASRLNQEGGFEPNIRVGIVKSTWTEKPPPGLAEDPGQDYGKIEAAFKVSYTSIDRDTLLNLLTERTKKAVRAEIWGELYASETLGIRQIHCRRASNGSSTDVRNRDGALKLYYTDENAAELFLFKFEGQK